MVSPAGFAPNAKETRVAPRRGDVALHVLVKIVTAILFGNAPLAKHETSVTVSGLAVDHRPAH